MTRVPAHFDEHDAYDVWYAHVFSPRLAELQERIQVIESSDAAHELSDRLHRLHSELDALRQMSERRQSAAVPDPPTVPRDFTEPYTPWKKHAARVRRARRDDRTRLDREEA